MAPRPPTIPSSPAQTSRQPNRQRGSAGSRGRAGVPAGARARGARASTYLLQQRDGVPAVVQPRSEAGRGGRVVVLGGLGDKLGDGDLVRHPAGGYETQAGAGGESQRRLPGPRAARRLMNAPRSPPPAGRPGAAPVPGGGRGRKGRAKQAAALGAGPFKLRAAREAGGSRGPASLCSCRRRRRLLGGGGGDGELRRGEIGPGSSRRPALPPETR